MATYIKLDLVTGKLKLINADKIPTPKENEIIYDPSLYSEQKGKVLKLSEIAEKYKQSQTYIEERDMGCYGSGLFTKSIVPANTLFLPYSGLYASITEKEKFERDHINSKYNFGNENAICWVNKKLCFAHSVQHFSKEKRNNNACSVNLFTGLIYFKIKFDGKIICLPLFFLSNIKTLDSNHQLGWDYGIDYWINAKSGFVEWDAKGNVVNKVALLGINFKGRDCAINVSQSPASVIYSFPEPYRIVFPKGIKEALFNSVNLQNILPVILLPKYLLANINKKEFIGISIDKFLDIGNIPEHNFPNYLFLNNKLYLGIEFLENLAPYELNELFVTLNVTEIICSEFEQSSLVSSNAKVSDELAQLFKTLNMTGGAVKNSEKVSLESGAFSNALSPNFFKLLQSKSSPEKNKTMNSNALCSL